VGRARTQGIVKLTIDGKKRLLDLVPKNKAEDIERLLSEYRADVTVSKESGKGRRDQC
jgi:hypothetical protein